MKKKVYASVVSSSNYDTFEQVLTGNTEVIHVGNKLVEIAHVEETETYVTGVFVSTQTANLAPQHQPGVEGDYSAIVIDEGKGLAYPTAFLYDRERHIILWEANTLGMNEKRFEVFFQQYDRNHHTVMQCSFSPVVTTDFLERITSLQRIDSFFLKIGDPLQILNRQDASFEEMRDLANSSNATGTIELKIKADTGHTLSIDYIRSQIQSILHLNNRLNAQIQCKTSGQILNDEDNLEKTTIDLLLDKFVTYYDIDRVDNASIQADLRKNGLRQAYRVLQRRIELNRI